MAILALVSGPARRFLPTIGIGSLLASAPAAWAQYTNDSQNIDFGAGNGYSTTAAFYVGFGYG
jgi:hypothetical protein